MAGSLGDAINARLRRLRVPPAILANTGWLLGDRVLRMLGNLVIGVLFARYLGPERLGLYNFAFAFASMMAPLMALGLDDLVVRDIVQAPDETGEILGTSFALKLMGGLAGIAASMLAAGASTELRAPGRELVAVFAFGLALQATDVVAFWFRANVNAKNVVFAKNSAFAVAAAVKLGLMAAGAPLVWFALATSAEFALGSLGLWIAYRLNGGEVRTWSFSWRRARALLRDGWPLLLSGIAITVYMKIDQLMLGQMVGPEAVGIYSTAVRISEIWYFVPLAISSSVAPAIIAARSQGRELYHSRLQRTFDAAAILAIGLAVVVTFVARPLIVALFGDAYGAAGPVLAVHIWAGVFVFLGVVRQPWIVAEGFTRVALLSTVLGAVTNVLLNLWLIPLHREMGAAIATVVSYGLSDYVMFLLLPPFRGVGLMMTRALLLGALRHPRGRS